MHRRQGMEVRDIDMRYLLPIGQLVMAQACYLEVATAAPYARRQAKRFLQEWHKKGHGRTGIALGRRRNDSRKAIALPALSFESDLRHMDELGGIGGKIVDDENGGAITANGIDSDGDIGMWREQRRRQRRSAFYIGSDQPPVLAPCASALAKASLSI